MERARTISNDTEPNHFKRPFARSSSMTRSARVSKRDSFIRGSGRACETISPSTPVGSQRIKRGHHIIGQGSGEVDGLAGDGVIQVQCMSVQRLAGEQGLRGVGVVRAEPGPPRVNAARRA